MAAKRPPRFQSGPLRCAGYGYEGGTGTTLRANRDSHSATVMSAQAGSPPKSPRD
jgi:hypothetical protein